MRVFTVGFTKKNARRFFGLLNTAGAKRVDDVRLNNVSQRAGFAKKDDLEHFSEYDSPHSRTRWRWPPPSDRRLGT